MGFFKKLLNKGGSMSPREKLASISPASPPFQPTFVFRPPPSNVTVSQAPGIVSDISSVNIAKVLQLLGADNEEQELKIRSLVEAPLQQNLLHLLISDDSDQRILMPELQGRVSSKDQRRKSESFLLPKHESTLVRFSSEAAVPSGRPGDERLVDPFFDSRSMSPTPSSQLSPKADSASTSVWSPPERSFTSTPQPSPRAKNSYASPLASPRRDPGFVAHPLPTPPPTSPTPTPGTRNLTSLKTFPLPLPLPQSQQADTLSCIRQQDRNHTKNHGSFREEQRSPLPSPLPSPCASPRSHQLSPRPSPFREEQRSPLPSHCPSPCASPRSHQLSPRPSPFRSPHRSPCTSPRLSPPHSPTRLSQCPRKWQRGQELGRGSFGTVFEGMNLEDGSFFAVKVSHDENISPQIQQEIAILSQLQHPNIVRYLGTSVEEGSLCIFLELMKCSLQSLLRKYSHFEEDTIRSYTRQILFGLEYLHTKRRVHRDIKCSNILVDVNGQVKLADFGVAKEVNSIMASSVKGTPIYMAPEVMDPSPNRSYGLPADIWSLGCTVLEMADGEPPWSHLPAFGFVFKVRRGELPPIPEHLSPVAKDFILKCLKLEPQDRPSASELLQHRFVANAPAAAPFSTFGSLPRTPPSMHSPNSVQEPVLKSFNRSRQGNNVVEANLRSILNETLPKQSLGSPRNSYAGISEAQHMWHNLSRSYINIELEARDEELHRFHL